MDCLTATKAIREQERVRGGHIPILAMSAHANHTDEEWCLSAGMDGYLPKPVNLTEVIQVVRKMINEGHP